MFDFFKKKEKPKYDVTNLSVNDLDVGFVFDYDGKSWVIEEAYEYDWGHENFSREYKANAGDETGYLNVEDAGTLNLSLVKEIRLGQIDEDVMSEVKRNQTPPRQLHFKGEQYFLENDSAGYFYELGDEKAEGEELMSWEYFNEAGDKILSLTQWDEYNIDAAAGVVIKPHQITDILPGG